MLDHRTNHHCVNALLGTIVVMELRPHKEWSVLLVTIVKAEYLTRPRAQQREVFIAHGVYCLHCQAVNVMNMLAIITTKFVVWWEL